MMGKVKCFIDNYDQTKLSIMYYDEPRTIKRAKIAVIKNDMSYDRSSMLYMSDVQ